MVKSNIEVAVHEAMKERIKGLDSVFLMPRSLSGFSRKQYFVVRWGPEYGWHVGQGADAKKLTKAIAHYVNGKWIDTTFYTD